MVATITKCSAQPAEGKLFNGLAPRNLSILIVTAMYPHAGHEGEGAFVMHQVEQLRAFQHQVDVLHFRGYSSKCEYLKAAFEVRRRTRGGRYDVVHAHYGVTGLPALFRCDAPLVVTLHGSDALCGWVEPAVSRLVCRLADGTVVVSKGIADKIPGEVIPCGVDLRSFKPKGRELARERLGLSLEKLYVLFPFNPGRRIKRYDLASGAVNALSKAGVNVELLTVSKVPNSEMPWYYSAANAMILFSDSEASPTSVKEALACNLPVVSTEVGDVKDIVEGIAGVYLCSQNIEALAKGLRMALAPPDGFVFDGRKAMERYDQEAVTEAIVRVYRRAIENRRLSRLSGSRVGPGLGMR